MRSQTADFGKQVDPSVLADLVQFLRVFADQCHHEKEEKHLFPLLATNANVSTRRELESLEREHRLAKQLVGQLAKVAAVYVHNPEAVRYRVIDLLQQLAELYPAHIWKEDFLLFPLAQQTLSTTEQQGLQAKFEEVEREVGEDVHAGFEKWPRNWRPLSNTATPALARCALRRRKKTSVLLSRTDGAPSVRVRATTEVDPSHIGPGSERRTTPPTSHALICGWTLASLPSIPGGRLRCCAQCRGSCKAGLQCRVEWTAE